MKIVWHLTEAFQMPVISCLWLNSTLYRDVWGHPGIEFEGFYTEALLQQCKSFLMLTKLFCLEKIEYSLISYLFSFLYQIAKIKMIIQIMCITSWILNGCDSFINTLY